jgi:hypothetical protein
MADTELRDAIQFAVAEVYRIDELYRTDFKQAAGQSELGYGMPSAHVEFPDRANRYYRTSKEAKRKLYQAVLLHMEGDADVCGRISPQTVFNAVQVEIAQRCIERGESITTQLASTLLRNAIDYALQKTVDRTYFFPVFSLHTAANDEFTVGAATFTKSKKFFEQHKADWQKSIENGTANIGDAFGAEQISKNIRWLYDSAERYYSSFPSIASVSVRAAEPELGRIAAARLLEASFNILRIFIPSHSDQFVGRAEDAPFRTESSWIERDPTGEFLASHSSRQVEPLAPNDALQKLQTRMPQSGFIAHLIAKQRSWVELRPIERRLINGLWWFGEGWKEQAPVAKLVKFAVCLETLLMTGEREAITETLAERIALLCGATTKEREDLYAEARKVYRARSKAVHGGMYRHASELENINIVAEKLCNFALFSCSSLFPILLGQRNEIDTLDQFFKTAKLGGLEEAAARIGASIHEIPHPHSKTGAESKDRETGNPSA